MYNVKTDKFVVKYLKKLGKRDKEYIIDRINQLKYDKRGYRLLDVSGRVELWELRCQNHRIYYTVENQFIVIENIEYEGNINVERASNKNRQQKIINYMKNKIKRQ